MKNIWVLRGMAAVMGVAIIVGTLLLFRSSIKHPKTGIKQVILFTTLTPMPSPAQKGNIVLASPKPNQQVSLPITLTGEARVFENQFQYRVLEGKTVFVKGVATAQSPEAGKYGAFRIAIASLPNPQNTHLTLELFDRSAKDGSQIDTVAVPVVFSAKGTTAVKVFFPSMTVSAGQECTTVVPAVRRIEATQSIARAALAELLKGVFAKEKAEGLYSNINEGVQIQKLTIQNGTALVDFSQRLEEGIGGSCKVASIRQQITQTLMQFPSVRTVVISINGRTEDILQP